MLLRPMRPLLFQIGACALFAAGCELDFEARGLSNVPDAAAADGSAGEDAAAADPCETLPEGAECGGQLDCALFAKELISDGERTACFAYQGKLLATCNSARTCVQPTRAGCVAQPRGELIAVCSAGCVRDGHRCLPGASISEVTTGSLCVIDAQTAMCNRSRCIDDPDGNGSIFEEDRCNIAGECTREIRDCEMYRCADQASCKLSCTTELDCIAGVACANGACKQP